MSATLVELMVDAFPALTALAFTAADTWGVTDAELDALSSTIAALLDARGDGSGEGSGDAAADGELEGAGDSDVLDVRESDLLAVKDPDGDCDPLAETVLISRNSSVAVSMARAGRQRRGAGQRRA